jgi:hypothetical protein
MSRSRTLLINPILIGPKSVHDIDLQLYRKYGLDEDEINFIETHVKEMA